MGNKNEIDQIMEHETPMHDNLVKLGLILTALAVLLTMVFVCSPGRQSLGLAKSLRASWHSIKAQFAHTTSTAKAVATQKLISYADPRVRSTLNVPWAN